MTTPFSAEYQAQAALRSIKPNYYVEISGVTTKFSKRTVVGLVTETTLSALQFNPSKLAIDNVQTTIGSLSFSLVDKSGTFLSELGTVSIHEQFVSLYVGFDPINFVKYKKIAQYRIEEVSFSGEIYKVNAKDSLRDLQQPILRPQSSLNADMTDLINVTDTIPAADTSVYPVNGRVKVGKETMDYVGKTALALGTTTLTRGADNSKVEAHKYGDVVYLVESLTANPIDTVLQLIVSPGGGGPYDVLSYGLGISSSRIDTAAFENVRDGTSLTAQSYRFDFSKDIDNTIEFFEKEILFFCNCRLFTNLDGLISLALVQQVTVDTLVGNYVRADILEVPDSVADSKRLYNRIKVKWDWSDGREAYQRETTFDDVASQAAYGIIQKSEATSKGIKDAIDGTSIITDFAARLFRRVAFPTNKLSAVKVLWNQQYPDIGDKPRFTHDQAVNLITGVQGIDQITEVLEKKWDFDQGRVTVELNMAEGLAFDLAFISPASDIVSAASTSVFDVPASQGIKWTVGWFIALWLQNGGVGPISTSEIIDVTGDTITVSPAFSTLPTIAHQVIFADYDDVILAQKVYGFWTDDNNDFPDGHAPYIVSE